MNVCKSFLFRYLLLRWYNICSLWSLFINLSLFNTDWIFGIFGYLNAVINALDIGANRPGHYVTQVRLGSQVELGQFHVAGVESSELIQFNFNLFPWSSEHSIVEKPPILKY